MSAKPKLKTLDEIAHELTRRLRNAKDNLGGDMIPAEGYQNRGRHEWDLGIAVALNAALQSACDQGRADERKALREWLLGRSGGKWRAGTEDRLVSIEAVLAALAAREKESR